MTKRGEKLQRKKEQRVEYEKERKKIQIRKRAILFVFKILSIMSCIVFFIACLLLSGKPQLLCILGIFWAWTIITFLNWRLNPSGTTSSVQQIGKSGTFQIVQYKNFTCFIISLAVAIILSVIIIPI